LDEIQRHYPTFAGVLELERRQVALELERLVQRWNGRAEAVLDSRHPERMLPAEFSGSAQISWWERAAAFGQSFPYSKRGVMKDIMTFHDQWMALARQPYHVDFVEPRFIPNPVTAGLLFTGIKHTWLRHLFVESQLGLLQVSLALHGFQLEKSSLPSSLAELAPGYLTVVPPDPFAPGATLRYRSTGSDYVVYSVGPDGKDDGGTFPANERYNLQGTNYIGDIGILRLHPSRK
jgi:hypothetical protein